MAMMFVKAPKRGDAGQAAAGGFPVFPIGGGHGGPCLPAISTHTYALRILTATWQQKGNVLRMVRAVSLSLYGAESIDVDDAQQLRDGTTSLMNG